MRNVRISNSSARSQMGGSDFRGRNGAEVTSESFVQNVLGAAWDLRSLGPVSGGKPRPAPRTPGKAQVWPRASEGTKRSPV